MEFNTEGFELIHSDGIYIFKNFMSAEECDLILKYLYNSILKERADKVFQITNIRYENNIIDLIANKLNNILTINNDLGRMAFYHTTKDALWHPHTDMDNWSEKDKNKSYGIVGYLTEFEGGGISYPEYNIKINPSPGDLLIHKSTIIHTTLPLKSGKRITFTSYIENYISL